MIRQRHSEPHTFQLAQVLIGQVCNLAGTCAGCHKLQEGIWRSMSKIHSFFPTLIYRADEAAPGRLIADLEQAALMLTQEDAVGIKWCEKHGYPGYTSYGSLDDLAGSVPAFERLEK